MLQCSKISVVDSISILCWEVTWGLYRKHDGPTGWESIL